MDLLAYGSITICHFYFLSKSYDFHNSFYILCLLAFIAAPPIPRIAQPGKPDSQENKNNVPDL